MKKLHLLVLLFFSSLFVFSQNISLDSLSGNKKTKFKAQALIIPTTLIGYGVISLESHTLKDINSSTKEELREHIDEKISIDDFSQYSPFATVYALNMIGIQGKNDFKNRTIILSTAYLIMGATVNIIKNTGNELRPDGTSYNSFPSGHTATAFMGAEFLFQEYKDQSVWYGVSGYLVAAGTGFFRMYNDRHWLSDITAGAGIGILSTKIAYWIYPLLKKSIFKDKKNINGMLLPTYNGKQLGLGAVIRF